MPLEDVATVCPGCKATFETGRGLLSHIRQTSRAHCRQVFDQYVQLAAQFDELIPLEENVPATPEDIEMADPEALDDLESMLNSPINSPNDVHDHLRDMDSPGNTSGNVHDHPSDLDSPGLNSPDDIRDNLPGLDSDGDDVEPDLWVDVDDIDVEVTSVSSSDEEEEDAEYLWHVD